MSGRLKDRVEGEALRILRERVARLRRSLDEALASVAEPLQFPLTPGEWGAAEGAANLQSVRDAIESIARGSSHREILTALLDAAAAYFPRSALFVIKGGSLTGWMGLGFLGEGGFNSDQLSRVALSAGGDHLLGQAVRRRALVRVGSEGPGQEIVSALGALHPKESCAVPLVVGGRIVAVLYGDAGSTGSASPAQGLPFDILARCAGLAMERTAGPAAAAGARAAAPPVDAAARSAAPRPTPGSAALIPRGGGPTPPEEAEMQALLRELDGAPRRPAGDDGLSDEERRRHADARRFASLLVSELLLYNEEAVIQGRKHRDLEQRLKKEIDRSRQAYQARLAGADPHGADYFQDELIRQLALGDPALLG
jgi:hypothetical protein